MSLTQMTTPRHKGQRRPTTSKKDKHPFKSSKTKLDHQMNQDPLFMIESFLTILFLTQTSLCFKDIFIHT